MLLEKLYSLPPEKLYAFGWLVGFLIGILLHLLLFSIFEYVYKFYITKKSCKFISDFLLDNADRFEGYYKFNPDGTVVKVSDLDIDCETVDINKPTK